MAITSAVRTYGSALSVNGRGGSCGGPERVECRPSPSPDAPGGSGGWQRRVDDGLWVDGSVGTAVVGGAGGEFRF